MKLLTQSLLAASLSISSFCYADVAVVVNSANASAVSDSEISRVFLGKLKKFSSGDSVTPVNSKMGGAVRNEFEQKVLRKSSSQVKAYWSKLVFSGKGKPPKEFGSDAEVLQFVAANPGAIGYVDAASVNDTVKVLKTF